MWPLLQRPGQPDLCGRRPVGERDGEYLVVLGAAGARFAAVAGDREAVPAAAAVTVTLGN